MAAFWAVGSGWGLGGLLLLWSAHFILTTIFEGAAYYPHFTDGETEAQSGPTASRWQSWDLYPENQPSNNKKEGNRVCWGGVRAECGPRPGLAARFLSYFPKGDTQVPGKGTW